MRIPNLDEKIASGAHISHMAYPGTRFMKKSLLSWVKWRNLLPGPLILLTLTGMMSFKTLYIIDSYAASVPKHMFGWNWLEAAA